VSENPAAKPRFRLFWWGGEAEKSPVAPWETPWTATWALNLRLQTVWCQWESDSGFKMEIPAKFLWDVDPGWRCTGSN
jgi:hypothetical protein